MEKKVIVTHKSPDLDSCVAIWILKRFVYKKYEFDFSFVDVGERLDKIKNSVHVDTGGVDYDHHDTNQLISSASLVYTKNNLNDKALEKIVEYTVVVDHGKTINEKSHFMHINNALNGLLGYDSLKVINSMLVILDGIYNSLNLKIKANEIFDEGIKFHSIFGSGLAYNLENTSLRKKVYERGYEIFLFKDKNTGFAGYKASGHSKVNFKGLFEKISEIEPNADWFLHSSGQLLLCGSSKAPQKRLTSLSLIELVEIISNYAKKEN
ncbi:MAG: DHH family phosphoesterase [Candidatus Woesearchaeota archaeon]